MINNVVFDNNEDAGLFDDVAIIIKDKGTSTE